MNKLNQNEVLEKFFKTHGNMYDYSDVEYSSYHEKVRINCRSHGPFTQVVAGHCAGKGCPQCGKERMFSKIRERESASFIERAKEIHQDAYSYEKLSYKNNNTKVKIICPDHGVFEQTPGNHLSGKGCKVCAGLCRDTCEKEFVNKANNVHGNKYDYSKVRYLNSRAKVEIGCPTHGIFEQSPSKHLNGGCFDCAVAYRAELRTKSAAVRFRESCSKAHEENFSYPEEYKGSKEEIEIICSKHGKFRMLPHVHLRSKEGCGECSAEANRRSHSSRMNFSFPIAAGEVHNYKYKYFEDYVNQDAKISIECPEHGIFYQAPNNHLHGRTGCPSCASSKGDAAIKTILEKTNVNYATQYSIEGCRNKKPLRFDFGIFRDNVLLGLIEFQGVQHYEPIDFFGGEEGHRDRMNRDTIKREFCLDNSIKLLEIPYWKIDELDHIITYFVRIIS